jgi:hypothetical protein
VPLIDLKSLNVLAAGDAGTSKSAALVLFPGRVRAAHVRSFHMPEYGRFKCIDRASPGMVVAYQATS